MDLIDLISRLPEAVVTSLSVVIVLGVICAAVASVIWGVSWMVKTVFNQGDVSSRKSAPKTEYCPLCEALVMYMGSYIIDAGRISQFKKDGVHRCPACGFDHKL